MTDDLPEQAFNREAAILLGRLALGKGYLVREAGRGPWSQWSGKNGYRRPVGEVDAALVGKMRERGLLAARPGGGLMPATAAGTAGKNNRPFVQVTIADPQGRMVGTVMSEAECALGWLRKRKDASGAPFLSDEQFTAAERLRGDYTRAQIEQRVTADWERPIEQGRAGRTGFADAHAEMSDSALAAKQRLFAALAEVGPELSGILLEVCCMAAGLESAERLLGLPQRSGKAILQLALTRLARHYGLLPPESAHLRDWRLRHWARSDYRPEIS